MGRLVDRREDLRISIEQQNKICITLPSTAGTEVSQKFFRILMKRLLWKLKVHALSIEMLLP